MSPRRPFTPLICGMILVASLVGCGAAKHSAVVHSTTPQRAAATTTSAHTDPAPTVHTICTAAAQAAVRRALGAAPVAKPSIANSSYPQCDMKVGRRGGTVDVLAEVDTETSAYAVLERTIVEASQVWPARLQAAPMHVGGLGIDASWFPQEQHLMTTDAVRLIIVGVTWRHVRLARRIALAKAVAHTYLGRLQPKLARGPAP